MSNTSRAQTHYQTKLNVQAWLMLLSNKVLENLDSKLIDFK